MKQSHLASACPALQPSIAWPRRLSFFPLILLVLWVNLRQTTTEIDGDEDRHPSATNLGITATPDTAESASGEQSTFTESLSLADKISSLNSWAQNQRARPASPMKPISASQKRNSILIPQHVPIDEKQDRTLGALRMRVPGKYIEYRTSPDSRAPTWLIGRVLEPAATENDSGLSLQETIARPLLTNNIDTEAIHQ